MPRQASANKAFVGRQQQLGLIVGAVGARGVGSASATGRGTPPPRGGVNNPPEAKPAVAKHCLQPPGTGRAPPSWRCRWCFQPKLPAAFSAAGNASLKEQGGGRQTALQPARARAALWRGSCGALAVWLLRGALAAQSAQEVMPGGMPCSPARRARCAATSAIGGGAGLQQAAARAISSGGGGRREAANMSQIRPPGVGPGGLRGLGVG